MRVTSFLFIRLLLLLLLLLNSFIWHHICLRSFSSLAEQHLKHLEWIEAKTTTEKNTTRKRISDFIFDLHLTPAAAAAAAAEALSSSVATEEAMAKKKPTATNASNDNSENGKSTMPPEKKNTRTLCWSKCKPNRMKRNERTNEMKWITANKCSSCL